MASPPRRPIRKLLVANRGEIATRIINAAREHDPPIEVFALATTNDISHTLSLPTKHVLSLSNASEYLNIARIIALVKEHQVDAIHPGYGFLSESAEFAQRAWDEAGAMVIGPGRKILERTGNKLAARLLAEECNVPVLLAMREPTGRVEDVRNFVESNGLPVMIKAVDGGGGRGIRLVRSQNDLERNFERAVQESPSQQIFLEGAAVDGFRHVEVQIIGDGTGRVAHLWERECSIQRRYQKIVEVAPSLIRKKSGGDQFVGNIIAAAVRMAQKVKYLSLGTFEFLANPDSKRFFFLEVNPRLQVEHTITEQITQTDIVSLQIDVAQGALLNDLTGLAAHNIHGDPLVQSGSPALHLHSIQLRLTAEDPQRSFTLNIGKVNGFSLPSGSGVRVETNLVAGREFSVLPDFDSLLAKVIVTGRSWTEAVRKARRALEDTRIDGVKTNVDILRGILGSDDFMWGRCDTQWLEAHLEQLLEEGQAISRSLDGRPFMTSNTRSSSTSMSGMSSSTVLFRKGDAWKISIKPTEESSKAQEYALKLNRILRNGFPSLLDAEIDYFPSGSKESKSFVLSASAASGSVSGIGSASTARRGDPSNPTHVIIPFPGTLVEVLVDYGDRIKPGQAVCVVKQMKMELEVRARENQTGTVKWVTDVDDGEEVVEGMLVAEIESSDNAVSAKL